MKLSHSFRLAFALGVFLTPSSVLPTERGHEGGEAPENQLRRRIANEAIPNNLAELLNEIEDRRNPFQVRESAQNQIRKLLMQDCGRYLPFLRLELLRGNRSPELVRRLESLVKEPEIDWRNTLDQVTKLVQNHSSSQESFRTAAALNVGIMAYNRDQRPDLDKLERKLIRAQIEESTNAAFETEAQKALAQYKEAMVRVIKSVGYKVLSEEQDAGGRFIYLSTGIGFLVQKPGTEEIFRVNLVANGAAATRVTASDHKPLTIKIQPEQAFKALQLACLKGNERAPGLDFPPLYLPTARLLTKQSLKGLVHTGVMSSSVGTEAGIYLRSVLPAGAPKIDEVEAYFTEEFSPPRHWLR